MPRPIQSGAAAKQCLYELQPGVSKYFGIPRQTTFPDMATEAAVLTATIILVALGLLFGFSNGFHDAANAVATVIATKSLTPRQAVYSSALFNFLPCLVQSTSVASTIAKIVDSTCISTNAANLDIPISNYVLPLPMIAGGSCPLSRAVV